MRVIFHLVFIFLYYLKIEHALFLHSEKETVLKGSDGKAESCLGNDWKGIVYSYQIVMSGWWGCVWFSLPSLCFSLLSQFSTRNLYSFHKKNLRAIFKFKRRDRSPSSNKYSLLSAPAPPIPCQPQTAGDAHPSGETIFS